MASNVNSMSFLLTAIIDGEDAVSLDVSPSSIVWNQEGDVSVDAQGNTVDNSSWPVQYITASVRKGDADESGWLYGFTIGSGCSFTVRKGTLSTDGKFTVDTNGNTFELSSPRKTKDASGKEAENLWTNGSIRITATKNGMKITKNAGIILNALATWKLSVVNGTATAVSSKVNAQVDGKIEKMQSEIKQSENEISLKVSSMTSGRNMWINGDFEMNPSMAPAYVHNTDGNTTVSDRIDSVDLHAGFTKRLVFNCPKTSYGIYYKTQKNITPSTLNSSNAYCLSFFAKATKTCEMTAGLEGIATGTVALTGQWKRYAIYIQKGIDYTKWNGSIIFYPRSAIGADQYVCITGIQMETGSETDGAPSVWAKSTDDIKQTTGIDITNGTVTMNADKTLIRGNNGTQIAIFGINTDGNPFLNTNLINADTINVNRLIAYNGSTMLTSINLNGCGEFIQYYPDGKRKMEISDGNIIYYKDDDNNSIKWVIGENGMSKSIDRWSTLKLCKTDETGSNVKTTSPLIGETYSEFRAGDNSTNTRYYGLTVFGEQNGTSPTDTSIKKIADGWYTNTMPPLMTTDYTTALRTLIEYKDGYKTGQTKQLEWTL